MRFECVCVEPFVCSWTLTCRWSVSRVCPHPCGRCPSDCRPEPSDTERNPYRWSYTAWLLHQDTGLALGNTHKTKHTHTHTHTHTHRKDESNVNALCDMWWEIIRNISASLDIKYILCLFANSCSCWTRVRRDKCRDRGSHLSVSVTDSEAEYYPSCTQSYRQLRFNL